MTRPGLVLWLSLLAAASLDAAPELAPLFRDHACLQGGKPLAVWGWSEPGATVTVRLAGAEASATAAADGRWQVSLPALTPGGPHVLTARDSTGETVAHDILVGEVWLASGQSNMLWPLPRAEGSAPIIADAARHTALRLYRIDLSPTLVAPREPAGRWTTCTPDELAKFSGVATFFALELQRRLDGRPVGIVLNALGGTPIESWLPPDVWKTSPEFTALQERQLARAEEHRQKKIERQRKAALRRAAAGKPAPAPDPAPSADPTDEDAVEIVDRNTPSSCYQAGIAPLLPLTMRGIIWYQGEWNAPRADEYRTLFPLLIRRWRADFGDDLPFYFVQLPNYGRPAGELVNLTSNWAGFRAAQTSALDLAGTGMAVAIDVGEATSLHPPRKREVGERLARLALARTHGLDIPADGPALLGIRSADTTLRLTFAHAAGLVLRAAETSGFAISADDKTYHPARARVEGDTVVLDSPAVPAPRHVRYLWANSPTATLFNSADLPAAPFHAVATP